MNPEIIKNTKKVSSTRKWAAWTIASIFYAYQYIVRVLPNIIMPQITEKFQIDAASFGQFSGLYYLAYAGIHIPVGLALDHLGPRLVMATSILMVALGLLPLVFAEVWTYPCIGRVLIGIGSSGAILGLFKIIRISFPEEKFTRMLGISITIGLLGAIYGGQPLSQLMQTYDWQSVVTILAWIGVALAISMILIVPKQPQSTLARNSIMTDLKGVFKNPTFLSICLLAGLLVGPLEGFADAWSGAFLKTVYSLKAQHAASLTSLIFLGMALGCPLLGYIGEKTKAHFTWIIIAAVTMALCFVALLSGLIPTSIIWIPFLITGIMCGYQVLTLYKAVTYTSESHSGLATAIANMIVMSFGYIFHGSIGKIMAVYSNDSSTYTHTGFTYAIAIIPIALTIGAIGFIMLRQKTKAC